MAFIVSTLMGLFSFVYKVGDFGDATNWPTPGEIAHKSVQVRRQNPQTLHLAELQ